jgi:hypothetical protein
MPHHVLLTPWLYSYLSCHLGAFVRYTTFVCCCCRCLFWLQVRMPSNMKGQKSSIFEGGVR